MFYSNVAPRRTLRVPDRPKFWVCDCGQERPWYWINCPSCRARRPE